MSKVAVVYWSSTGNTEAMANAVADGIKEKGGEAVLHTCEDFDGSKVAEYDAIAFGCPAMGDEVLEDTEFEPMFDGCKDALKGKKYRSVWFLRMGRWRMDAQLGRLLQGGWCKPCMRKCDLPGRTG